MQSKKKMACSDFQRPIQEKKNLLYAASKRGPSRMRKKRRLRATREKKEAYEAKRYFVLEGGEGRSVRLGST